MYKIDNQHRPTVYPRALYLIFWITYKGKESKKECAYTHIYMYVCIAEFGFPDSLADRESACNAGETSLILGLGRSPWRRHRLPSPAFLGFLGGSDGKESTCRAGHLGSIPGLGRSSGGGHGNLLQYSGLENPYGQKSLVGYVPWGHKELDLTGRLSTAQHNWITLLYIWN